MNSLHSVIKSNYWAQEYYYKKMLFIKMYNCL